MSWLGDLGSIPKSWVQILPLLSLLSGSQLPYLKMGIIMFSTLCRYGD